MNHITIKIIEQGAPLILPSETGHVVASESSCIAVHFDMQSKRCVVSHASNTTPNELGEMQHYPSVSIAATDDSYPISEYHNGDTCIAFPGLTGWEIFLADICKYTLSICFIRKEIESA